MTFAAFKNEIQRIGKVFGMEKYPEERLAILWRSLSRISDAKFAMVVDELIANQRQPPMLKEFAEAAAKIREPKQQDQSDHKCGTCLDDGMVLVDRNDGIICARPCECQGNRGRGA